MIWQYNRLNKGKKRNLIKNNLKPKRKEEDEVIAKCMDCGEEYRIKKKNILEHNSLFCRKDNCSGRLAFDKKAPKHLVKKL